MEILYNDTEFDCAECGRHIVQLCGSTKPLCAMCLVLPGWFNDADAVRILDPDNKRNPPAHEIVRPNKVYKFNPARSGGPSDGL